MLVSACNGMGAAAPARHRMGVEMEPSALLLGLPEITLCLATRHYFGWCALDVLELEPHVIAEQLGHHCDERGSVVGWMGTRIRPGRARGSAGHTITPPKSAAESRHWERA